MQALDYSNQTPTKTKQKMSSLHTTVCTSIHPLPQVPPSTNSCTKLVSSSYSFSQCCFSTKLYQNLHIHSRTTTLIKAAIPSRLVKESLPPPLDASSDPPSIFDGIPKLYISYSCPYAQRVWITRNVKGLQDKIKLVPIDLKNRPVWYKEKVYSANKVPALEYNNEVKGESLDLMKYIDTTFEGPSLFPDDPIRRSYGEELLAYVSSFYKLVITAMKEDQTSEADVAFDHIEDALAKYGDGPFLLGDLSLVDIAYVPFVERFQPFLLEVKNYDITKGRPKLTEWIEAMNKIEAYKETKQDPAQLVESYKRRFSL